MSLGKRARTTESYRDNSISSRVKRRAHVFIANDENVDPNDLPNAPMVFADPDTKSPAQDKESKLTPSKRVFGTQRVALSPRKANGQDSCSDQISSCDQENIQLSTPKTPRHRDALSKRIPVTPRHRIGLIGKPLTPRTPRTASTPRFFLSPYDRARKLFSRSADPGPLLGREEERKVLCEFVEKCIASQKGGCTYVSGPPGTGKSALVSELCRGFGSAASVKTVYINCMSAKSSQDIHDKLTEEILDSDIEADVDQSIRLRSVLIPKKRVSDTLYMVILDEIDHLLTLDLEILYTLFEWSLHRSSRLIVVGIANALDLTDRFLPRLKSRNLKPRLLPFLPYTALQIATVISTKLKSLLPAISAHPTDYVPILQPTAIQLCSKKVASQSGDLRKAFDIIRRTIDLVEDETKQKLQRDIASQNLSTHALYHNSAPSEESPATSTSSASTAGVNTSMHDAPRATIAHVSRVSATMMSNGTNQRLQSLNLQQKAVLCSLMSHQKSSRSSASAMFATPSKASAAPTIRKLYGTYSSLCNQENAIHPLTCTEFVDVVSGLETLGLIREEKAGRGFGAIPRTPSKKMKGMAEDKKIVAYADEEQIRSCLTGLGGGILLRLLSQDI